MRRSKVDLLFSVTRARPDKNTRVSAFYSQNGASTVFICIFIISLFFSLEYQRSKSAWMSHLPRYPATHTHTLTLTLFSWVLAYAVTTSITICTCNFISLCCRHKIISIVSYSENILLAWQLSVSHISFFLDQSMLLKLAIHSKLAGY